MSRLVDLQSHSTYSDGTCTPREIVELAAQAGLAAVALTDHDTVAGVPEFIDAGSELGVETLPAIELSVTAAQARVDILGYLIDPASRPLTELIQQARAYRAERLPEMLEALDEADVPLEREAVEAIAGGTAIGRPHIAQALVAAGHAGSVGEAFDELIGRGQPGYVPKRRLDPAEAIEAIHAAGGVAVLAHPCLIHPAQLMPVLDALTPRGLDGLEVYYSAHDAEHVRAFTQIAEARGLVKTGGSDFHGENRPEIQLGTGRGDLAVPYDCVEALKQRAKRYA